MRDWAAWGLGAVLAVGVLVAAMAVASTTSGAMWLPVALGLGFYAILGLVPRAKPVRAAISTAFGAGACALWLGSSAAAGTGKTQILFVAAFVAAVAGVIAASQSRMAKHPPRLAPIWLLMALGWLIAYFSSSHGSADPMLAWVRHVFHLSPHAAEILVVSARKAVHFTFYAFVALVGLATALRNGTRGRRAFAVALLLALLFAAFDEIRQSAMPDRGGSGWDVMLDMAGAGVAVLVASAVSPKIRRK